MENKYALKVVPSPQFPNPGNGNYYNGGFITQKYGNPSNRLNAIQIELPFAMRDDRVYDINARLVAACIYEYYVIHGFDKIF
jgi:hypothetical protein